MVEKIANWWLTGVVLLLAACFTFGPFAASIVVSAVTNNWLWMLVNLVYLILGPLFILFWGELGDLVKDGGLL